MRVRRVVVRGGKGNRGRKGYRGYRKDKKRRVGFFLRWVFLLSFFVSLTGFAMWWRSGWDGKEPINLVIGSGEQVWVAGLRPEESRAVIIEIPPMAIVPSAAGGLRQSRALRSLSELANDLSIVADAGWRLLEIPVDGAVFFGEWSNQSPSFFSLRRMSGEWSLPAGFRLVRFLHSLSDDRIQLVRLGELETGIRRVVDPGGAELLEVDTSLIAPLISNWFSIVEIRSEEIATAIVNRSTEIGVGGQLARQLSHVGVQVVSVGSGIEEPHSVPLRQGLRLRGSGVRPEASAPRDSRSFGGTTRGSDVPADLPSGHPGPSEKNEESIGDSDEYSRYQVTVRSKGLLESLTVRKLSDWLGVEPVVGEFEERADVMVEIW